MGIVGSSLVDGHRPIEVVFGYLVIALQAIDIAGTHQIGRLEHDVVQVIQVSLDLVKVIQGLVVVLHLAVHRSYVDQGGRNPVGVLQIFRYAQRLQIVFQGLVHAALVVVNHAQVARQVGYAQWITDLLKNSQGSRPVV